LFYLGAEKADRFGKRLVDGLVKWDDVIRMRRLRGDIRPSTGEGRLPASLILKAG
jgi:hypothetical protein